MRTARLRRFASVQLSSALKYVPELGFNFPPLYGAMKYRCDKCGRSWWMFLEKGIEEFGKNHKPSPFCIMCRCGGTAMDVSGIVKIPDGGYKPLPAGEGYFANKKDSDCGVPVLPVFLQ